MKKRKTYDDLYLAMIKIGQAKVSSGISYNKMLTELNNEGYDLNNDCVEKAVRVWFCNAFYHIPSEGKRYDSIRDLPYHRNCNFILRGESSLLLLEHKKSENALWATYIATIMALFAVILSLPYVQDNLREVQGKKSKQNNTKQEVSASIQCGLNKKDTSPLTLPIQTPNKNISKINSSEKK